MASTLPKLSLITSLVDQIITGTAFAVDDMKKLNQNIINLRPQIRAHNRSAAGAATERRLDSWTTEFPFVFRDMEAINNRVHAMKLALMRGADEATVLAAGG